MLCIRALSFERKGPENPPMAKIFEMLQIIVKYVSKEVSVKVALFVDENASWGLN